MSTLTEISKKLAALTNTVNTFLSKARKTSDLPPQTELVPTSMIRVFINGESKYVTVEQIVNSAVLSNSSVGINGIVSGTLTYVGGLTYRTLNLVYRLNNKLYYSNGFDVTAESDPNNPRISVIYGDSDFDGDIFVVDGDPAPSPFKPTLEWSHQIELTQINVPQGATEPEGVSTLNIYNENLQEAGGEFDTVVSANVVSNSVEDPLGGTKSIKFTSASKNNFVKLNSATLRNGSDISFLKVRVKLISSGVSLRIKLLNGAIVIGDAIISNGTAGFNGALLNEWQTVSVSGSSFVQNGIWNGEQYNSIEIYSTVNSTTMFLDIIEIVLGIPEVPTQNGNLSDYMLKSVYVPIIESKASSSEVVQALTDANAYTDQKITDNEKFRGTFLNETDLTTQIPAGQIGWAADVDSGPGATAKRYIWDVNEGWVPSTGEVAGETASSIRTKYLSNLGTEELTTALKAAYDNVVNWISTNGQNVLDHIGSLHAPSNAQKNSDILKAEIEAKLTGEITSHTHPAAVVVNDVIPVSASRLFLQSDKGKLLVVSQAVTLTMPSTGLSSDWSTDIDCLATGTATIAKDAGVVVLDGPDGLILDPNKYATIYRRAALNEYRIRGGFKV